MSTPAPRSTGTGATPGPGVNLGDGTVQVPARRGQLRLSETRTRWWNGRVWEPIAASTPWDAILGEGGTTWWDGQSWQPVRKRLAWVLRPLQLSVLQLAVPVVVLILLEILGGPAVIAFLIVHLGIYFGATASSRALSGEVRGAYFLSLVGLAGLGLMRLWRRVVGGDREIRQHVSGPMRA